MDKINFWFVVKILRIQKISKIKSGEKMRTSSQSVENILGQKTFAVVGVSRNGKKFGNAIYKEMKKKGYRVFAVNSYAGEIEGEKCFASLKDLPEKPGAVILSVKPSETEKVVREAFDCGIKNIWMQQGSESEEAVKFCKENNINEVHKECFLMFANPVDSVHKFHRFIWKVLGKLPN